MQCLSSVSHCIAMQQESLRFIAADFSRRVFQHSLMVVLKMKVNFVVLIICPCQMRLFVFVCAIFFLLFCDLKSSPFFSVTQMESCAGNMAAQQARKGKLAEKRLVLHSRKR